MKIKLSKSQWEFIGKRTGWNKKAGYTEDGGHPSPDFYQSSYEDPYSDENPFFIVRNNSYAQNGKKVEIVYDDELQINAIISVDNKTVEFVTIRPPSEKYNYVDIAKKIFKDYFIKPKKETK